MPGCNVVGTETLSQEQRETLAWRLSDGLANRFTEEVLAPALGVEAPGPFEAKLRETLDDPVKCLRLIFGRYAFARRGKDRRTLADTACAALDRWMDSSPSFEKSSPALLWDRFAEVCAESGRRPQEDINEAVITGLAKLCQDCYRDTGESLARATAEEAFTFHRIEPAFFSIVGLKGVGPKFAATMLRDWAFAYEFESTVSHRDTIYLQPIDRWIRLAGPWLIEEPGAADFPDWILAGKFGKAARGLGISGIRINMGVSQLGLECHHMVQPEPVFQDRLNRLSQPKASESQPQSHPA